MGGAMASRMLAEGFPVTGYDASATARQTWRGSSLNVAETLQDLAGVDVLILSLPNSDDVSAVLSGPKGLLASLDPGAVVADLSTISPKVSEELAREASARGIGFLDAPVSGSPVQVSEGTAALYIGGSAEYLERADPILASFSAIRSLVGPNGSGLRLKLIANRLFTTHLAAIAESIVELRAFGIDEELGLDLLSKGAVPRILSYKAVPMAKRNWKPGFTVGLMSKDLRLMAEQIPAGTLGAHSHALIENARAQGLTDSDVGAILLQVEQDARTRSGQ